MEFSSFLGYLGLFESDSQTVWTCIRTVKARSALPFYQVITCSGLRASTLGSSIRFLADPARKTAGGMRDWSVIHSFAKTGSTKLLIAQLRWLPKIRRKTNQKQEAKMAAKKKDVLLPTNSPPWRSSIRRQTDRFSFRRPLGPSRSSAKKHFSPAKGTPVYRQPWHSSSSSSSISSSSRGDVDGAVSYRAKLPRIPIHISSSSKQENNRYCRTLERQLSRGSSHSVLSSIKKEHKVRAKSQKMRTTASMIASFQHMQP